MTESERHANVLRLILTYHRKDADPLDSIAGLLHDFDMQMSDHMRGRSAFTSAQRVIWYQAYFSLCHEARVIPHPSQAIFNGEYIENYAARAEDMFGEEWAWFNGYPNPEDEDDDDRELPEWDAEIPDDE